MKKRKSSIPAWWGPPGIGWIRLWCASYANPVWNFVAHWIVFWDKVSREHYWKKLDRKWKRKRARK